MMKTEKLFYLDSHMTEFDATVLSCEKHNDRYKVVLDRTTFFPEEGGQYADTGMLNDARVCDVQEESAGGGTILYHYTDRPFTVGEQVHGIIDWKERFEKMQQHTGEHIVSGIVNRRFGYTNVGFHLGADYCTMDFDGPITKEQLAEVEEEANAVIFRNTEVSSFFPSKEELQTIPYRSKIEIEGQVRLVTIEGVDICACCAPHVKTTGEVGLLKLVNCMNYKGGVRMTMQCGFRALADYKVKEQNCKRISAALCAKEYEVADAVERLLEEEKSLRSTIAELKDKLLAGKAKEIVISEEPVWVFDAGLQKEEPRELMNLVLTRGAKVCGVFAGNDAEGYRYVIGSESRDVREYANRLREHLQARGGGKPEMVQGVVTASEEKILQILHTSDVR